MESFLGGLALAVITALAWLAYRHPKSYNRALGYLMLLGVFCASCFTAWGFGLAEGATIVFKYVPMADRAAAEAAIDRYNLPFWPSVLIPPAAVGYLLLLSYLPALGLTEQDKENRERDRRD